MPPPGVAPPFDDHQFRAHGDFAVGDQALEKKGFVGLAEASTADQSEAGEEPQLVARPASPTKRKNCCRQTDYQ